MTTAELPKVGYEAEDFDLDKLDGALRPYLNEGPFGARLNHPLVQQVFPPIHVSHANAMLQQKLKRLIEYEEEGELESGIWLYERPWRLMYLDLLIRSGKLGEGLWKEVLGDVWIDAEMPSNFGVRRVISLFKKVGFTTDMEHPETFALPHEPVQLYRGVRDHRHARGVSWTKSGQKAAWFAKRYSSKGEGYVYEATVAPKLILGIFQGRGEDEVVVDITRLRKADIRQVQ